LLECLLAEDEHLPRTRIIPVQRLRNIPARHPSRQLHTPAVKIRSTAAHLFSAPAFW
jgi:hypothetical protein